MCTVLLPPGDNPIAVNKYIISYHMCHSTKATRDSRFNNSGTERTLNLEELCWLHRTESTKENIFHLPSYDPLQESQLSRDPALFSCSPSQHYRRTTNFLSKRVLTLWIIFLYTFKSPLKIYAIPNLAFCLHQRVEFNWTELNDSRIGLSFVLIINKIYTVMITHIVIAYSITLWLFLLCYMERRCHH
jgi:hypothetical protein